MRKPFLRIFLVFILAIVQTSVHAQAAVKYNFTSQQKLLPSELGTIYMGIDLKAFSIKIKIDAAEVDDRFEELRLEIPFEKSNI